MVTLVCIFLIANDKEHIFIFSPFVFHSSTFFADMSVPLHYFTYGTYP